MQLISNGGLADWSLTRLQRCKPAMIGWLLQQGHAQPLCVTTADDIISMLHTTLTSEDGQWVLKARDNAENELAIESLHQQAIERKVIDRTFVEGDIRWIVDYKSVDLDKGISESALQAIAEKYREQLEGYAQLFAYEGLSIQKAILFLSVGKLVNLE
jgi:ATP-dependent exoDNAse (exonuclease V) beta subunit